MLLPPLQMVSAWKESGKLKDLKIEELNFQLGQAAAQLEAAKQEAAALQQQLADTSSKVGLAGLPCLCHHALPSEHDSDPHLLLDACTGQHTCWQCLQPGSAARPCLLALRDIDHTFGMCICTI